MQKLMRLLESPDFLVNKQTNQLLRYDNKSVAMPFISFDNGMEVVWGEWGDTHGDLYERYKINSEDNQNAVHGRIFKGVHNYISIWFDSYTRRLTSTQQIVNILKQAPIKGEFLYDIYDRSTNANILIPVDMLPSSVQHYRTLQDYTAYIKRMTPPPAKKKISLELAKYNDIQLHPQLYFDMKQQLKLQRKYDLLIRMVIKQARHKLF